MCRVIAADPGSNHHGHDHRSTNYFRPQVSHLAPPCCSATQVARVNLFDLDLQARPLCSIPASSLLALIRLEQHAEAHPDHQRAIGPCSSQVLDHTVPG